jgi:hypothetical protein
VINGHSKGVMMLVFVPYALRCYGLSNDDLYAHRVL